MTEVDSGPVTRLRLVASSIAGRMLDVRPGETGVPAWTDGRVVYVDPDAIPREQLQAACIQAALIAAGSLDHDVLRRLVARPALVRRYLAVEVPRALTVVEDRLAPAATVFVDRIGPPTASPMDSLAVARADRDAVDVPVVFGAIRPRAVVGTDAEPDVTSTAALDDRRQGQSRAPADDLDEPADDDTAGVPDFLTDPGGGGGPLGRLLQRMLRYRRNPGGGPLGGDVPPRGRRVSASQGRGRYVHAPAVQVEGGEQVDAHADRVYPEWDMRRGAYRRDWCTVREEEPPVDGVTPRRGREAALRRPLSRLALGLEVARRRPQGEDIDIDAAIEARVDLAAGVDPADAVYLESLRRRHDLAVVVLLDISGSANEPSGAGGTVHQHQLAGATALVRAVHALGNRVAVYGFYSQGRSAVRVVRVKRFDDAMNTRVLRRLGSLEPGGYTRFGAVIRHGTELLEERGGGSRRLLIVLSDGFAYDHGYGGRYGEADARKALAEARRRGVGCLCLSIGAATDLAALRRVFGSAAHATVRDPDELVQVVGPLFRDAIRSAELQRNVSDRERLVRRRSA